MTHNEKILEHIDFYGGITNAEAMNMEHVGRLASRVCELRHKFGYDLPMEWVPNETVGRHGRYVFSENDKKRYRGIA